MAAATSEQIAAWPPPNFKNPDSLQGLVIGLVVPVFSLSVIFIAVRFYGKGLLRQILGADDYIMLAATILAIPVSVFPLASLNLGLGLHIWDQKEEWYIPYWKMGYSADLLFPAACSLTKVSLCLTYIRLFPGRNDKRFCYALSIFVGLYTVTCLFLSLFQCLPINGYWNKDVVPKCINMRATLITVAALNSFSDFLVYLWPAKPLWSLQLPTKQRLGLIFLFSVGLLVCVAGILRMYYLEVFFGSYDTRWTGSAVWSCMVVEMDLGIICGCLSGVKPVLATFLPSIFGTSNRSKSGDTRPIYGDGTGRRTLPESSHRLSDASTEPHDERLVDIDLADIDLAEAIQVHRAKQQRNFAWASSNGDMRADFKVPSNRIAVNQVVTVEQKASGAVTPPSGDEHKLSDARSEECIMDVPSPREE